MCSPGYNSSAAGCITCSTTGPEGALTQQASGGYASGQTAVAATPPAEDSQKPVEKPKDQLVNPEDIYKVL